MAKEETTPAEVHSISRADLGGPEPTTAAASVAPGADIGQDAVQAAVDAEEDQGYHGVAVDPTPNSAYTVAGVTSGAPTPETDAAAAQTAQQAGRNPAPKETT